MEQSYEFTLSTIRRTVLERTDINSLYIPLQGKHTTNSEEEPFDLAEKIQSFFVFDEISRHDPKVMLLMGDTGSGKSVFTQQLHQQLWRAYKAGDPIPLWIPLPELQNPFEGAVEEVFKKYGFDDRQISEIKAQEKFIFIVDGYDELHQFQNCYVTNKWEKWNAKVLITCRSQALYYQKDPDKYFMPFNGDKRLPMLLRRLYVAPFSKEQISAYVIKYQELNPEYKFSEEDFTKVPGLIDLITTPFLLHLAVEALPDILANQVDDQKTTQAKLYDVFIERWFTRQVKKLSTAGLLKDTEENTKQQFWSYCKKLAQKMHEKEVSVIPYQGQKVGGRLFGKQEQGNNWESFFNEDTEVLRSACPLRRYGEHYYGFVHASMVEYFATRSMYEEIQDDNPEKNVHLLEDKEKDELTHENKQPKGGIHQRLFALERQGIQFLADRIEMSDEFQQKILMILETSKINKRFATGAANAVTALVRAGVQFNDANLSGINIPGADISGGFFCRANISNADLTNVRMFHVWLECASLEGSQLQGVNFGEYFWFKEKEENYAGNVDDFDFREDLHRLVTSNYGEIILWDTETGKELKVLNEYPVGAKHRQKVNSVKFSPNGEWIMSTSDKTVCIWNVSSGKELQVMKKHEGLVNCLEFSPDGHQLVLGYQDNTLRIWNTSIWEELCTLKGHEGLVKFVSYSPDGKRIVSLGDDKTILIWDVSSMKSIAVLHDNNHFVSDVHFSVDGERVALISQHNIRVFNLASGVVSMLLKLNGAGKSVAISSDWKQVVTNNGWDDLIIRVWEVESGKIISRLCGHEHDVNKVTFTMDGQRVVSSGRNSVRIWDIESGRIPLLSRGHKMKVTSVAFSPDGRLAASGSHDRTVLVWEVTSGKVIAELLHKDYVNSVAFSPDGISMVTGEDRNRIQIWNIAKREVISILNGHRSDVYSLQFSPDGMYIVAGSGGYNESTESKDNTIYIWDVKSGKIITELQEHTDEVRSVAFSPDGRRIVSGGFDNYVYVWEIANRKIIAKLKHPLCVMSVAFSPDGKYVVTGGNITDNRVRLWEVATEKEISRNLFHGNSHGNTVNQVVFSSDGKLIISGSADCKVKFWDVSAWLKNDACNFGYLNRRAEVVDVAYHLNGLFIIGFNSGRVECWQLDGWQFCWSSEIHSSALEVAGLNLLDVVGLSDQNRLMLEQRCADFKGKPKPKLQEDKIQRTSSAKTKWRTAKQAGSPIHQNNNNETKSDNAEDEEKARRCVIA